MGNLVLHSGNTVKVFKKTQATKMVAENTVKNTCRKQNTYTGHIKLSII